MRLGVFKETVRGSGAHSESTTSRSVNASSFIEQAYCFRLLGVSLAALCIASVLYRIQAPSLLWRLLLADVLAWPHMAYAVSRLSKDPRKAERRNLLVDAGNGAMWTVLMRFDPLPSAVLFSMLAMDRIAVGGWKLFGHAVMVMLITGFFTVLVVGFRFDPGTDLKELWLCLPFLILYPLIISDSAFRLARQVSRQNRELAQLTRLDPLTGLLNRQSWTEAVEAELRRSKRTRRPAALLFFDVDRFKKINDLHGHVVGDSVLRRVADIVARHSRNLDIACRYGGDEFGVLLLESDSDRAISVARRLCKSIQEAVFSQLPGYKCSVSIGISTANDRIRHADDWIDCADRAMYAAKAAGRNRWAVFER